MKYLVQIDGTNPKNWREIQAESPFDAIVKASAPVIIEGHNPETAYCALGQARHENGAPICVQSYSLKVNRESEAKP